MDFVLNRSSSSSSEGHFEIDQGSDKRKVSSSRSNGNDYLRTKSKKDQIAELNQIIYEREVEIEELKEQNASLGAYIENSENQGSSNRSQMNNIGDCENPICIELKTLYEKSMQRNVELRKKFENEENDIELSIEKNDKNRRKHKNNTQETLHERQRRLEADEPSRIQQLARDLENSRSSNFKLKLALFVMSACLIGMAGYAVYGKDAIAKEGIMNFVKSIDFVKIQGLLKTNFASFINFLNRVSKRGLVEFTKIVNQLKHLDHKNYLLLIGRNLGACALLFLVIKTSIFLINKLVRLISQMFNIIDDRRFIAAIFLAAIVWTFNPNLVTK
ncbi:MAG: hypothetical protein C5B43_00680 [Verrucomicrobia bacterium]|nr:MAG: hypothetical protein C5B43_00680 [Verrucomicrobiota bacterium]